MKKIDPDKDKHLPVPPKTTVQEDMVTAGQRRINLIWEHTQAFIAIFSTISVSFLSTWLAVTDRIEDFPPFIALAYGLVIGCYFQRTNHTAIGGVNDKYTGR